MPVPPGSSIRVEHVEMPYAPAGPDHYKAEALDYGGQGYEFSSPFAFSQGEGDRGTASMNLGGMNLGAMQQEMQQEMQQRLGQMMPPGAHITTETYSSVQINTQAQNTHGLQQDSNEFQYRPGQQMQGPPMQYGGPPPMQQQPFYGEQPFGPSASMQQPFYGEQPFGRAPSMQQEQPFGHAFSCPPQGGYGGPPPGYQQGPPQGPPQGAPGGRLEGWLAKRSDGGIASAWNMRWWRLADDVMAYSRDEKGPEAGRIQLTAKTEIRPISAPTATVEGRMMASKKPFAFELFQGVGLRTYYMDAGSAQKRDLWMATLAGVADHLRQQAPMKGKGGGKGKW